MITLTTLDHFHSQIPLECFGAKIAHIKVTPEEEMVGDAMEKELAARGFKVIKTVAEWTRGTSHQQAYLSDVIKVSKEPSIYQYPHVIWVEDDSPILTHKDTLETVLARMVKVIESSPDTLSARFIRRGDYEGGVPSLLTNQDHFFSPYTDFQPAIWRARDFYLATKIIEDNWGREWVQHTQCEALWRMITDSFSRSPLKHLVWLPDYAESIHLGSPDYPELKKRLV